MSSSEEDLIHEEDDEGHKGGGHGCPAWVPSAVSNFTIQLNFASASMAELFMQSHNDETGVPMVDFPQPQWVHSVMKSSVFVGSIAGMLIMGKLGDMMGIRKALIVTNSLVVFSALASSFLVFGEPDVLWGLLVFWRFLLGVGVGGNYPLSAAKASSVGTVEEAVSKAGRAFFWQGPGSVAPYLIGYLLLFLPHDNGITNLQFRLVMGIGAIPSAMVVYFMLKEQEEPKRHATMRKTVAQVSHSDKIYRKSLVGTAGTWLFFDIAYYGTNIFAPVIMKEIFTGGAPLQTIVLRSAILPVCGIAGTLIGIPLLGIIGPQALNAVGLVIAAFLYIIFVFIKQFHPEMTNSLFLILCAVFFILKGGPDIATYVLPVMSFPRGIRATYHGRSGSAGKVGAMLGTFIFPLLMDATGLQGVFIVQAVACIISAGMGIFLIRPLNMEEEITTPHGRRMAVGTMDQDQLEDDGLEDDVYAPEDARWEATTQSVESMRHEIATLNNKVDILMKHMGVEGSTTISNESDHSLA